MPEFRRVTAAFAVSPQISPEDVRAAAQAGYRLIVNNRPEGEAPDQPAGAEIEAAARAAGLDYVHIPVIGRPTADQAREMKAALDAAAGPALAFCRSGTRSITAWSIGQAMAGADVAELKRLGAAAGYDLSAVLG